MQGVTRCQAVFERLGHTPGPPVPSEEIESLLSPPVLELCRALQAAEQAANASFYDDAEVQVGLSGLSSTVWSGGQCRVCPAAMRVSTWLSGHAWWAASVHVISLQSVPEAVLPKLCPHAPARSACMHVAGV